MKTLAFAALLFSLPVSQWDPPKPGIVHEKVVPKVQQHGRWYMADTGHAVYCIGPVVVVPDHDGGLLRAAHSARGGPMARCNIASKLLFHLRRRF
jgi:hypothetical protein